MYTFSLGRAFVVDKASCIFSPKVLQFTNIPHQNKKKKWVLFIKVENGECIFAKSGCEGFFFLFLFFFLFIVFFSLFSFSRIKKKSPLISGIINQLLIIEYSYVEIGPCSIGEISYFIRFTQLTSA